MINVVVVDDHAVFREGLRALLARVADITVVGEASNTDEAVAVSADAQPDVVLMDLNLPGGGGEVATRRILTTRPETAVLVLTMHADGGHLQQALGAGARGYLLKDAEPAAIVHAITSVHLGQAIFDPGVASHVLAAAAAPGSDRPFPVLTEREFEVLDRIARGLGNAAIADRMGISRKTVQNNVSSILLKLRATDRAQAVAMARDAGLGSGGLT
jgi:DNA-binding NarL/FixJ family response regulator